MIRLCGIGVRPQELLMLGVAVVIMIGFDCVMNRTMVGKAMRAVAHNGNVASLMGINANAVMIGAFVISSALAGLSRLPARADRPGLAVHGSDGRPQGLLGRHDRRPAAIRAAASSAASLLGVLESLVNLWQAQWREVAVFAPRDPGPRVPARRACSASKLVEKV